MNTWPVRALRGCFVLLALLAWPLAAWAQAATAPGAGTPGAGTEGRHWLAQRPTVANPRLRYTVKVEDGIQVIARDGTRLEARLFRPVLAAGTPPTPCVLMTDGYGRGSVIGASFEGQLFEIASRGYAVLHLSLRGSGHSGGRATLYNAFGDDGYDAIEWMAKQPWCNGRVGMVGPSLLGISQWLAAKEAPPHLRAIVPEVACGDCYDYLWYPGGMRPGPGREARKLSPGAEGEYVTAAAHRDEDGWWRAHTTLADDARAIAGRGVAAFMAGGLDDYITPATVKLYEQFNAPGGARKRLLLGPFAHGWHTLYLQELQVQWLDHWLKDAPNGADTAPRVMLYVKGPNRWRYESDWPIPDAKQVTLFLQAARSGSIASLNDGGLAATPPAAPPPAPVAVAYTPGSGPTLPVLLSATRGRSHDDQRPDEAKVLTWTTPPLTVPTEVTGEPRLTLWAASSADDGDLVASLDDVAPDGSSHQVVQGYLNARHADSLAVPVKLTPGAARRFVVELLPTAYVFPAGHRIRLALAGGARAAAGLPAPQGPGQSRHAFTWTVLEDAQHPSALALPIIGTSDGPLAALRPARP
ncbi:MAG: CocE/NonD family hydrolase [Rhodospirillales bacterium]|nr:CocE/NonD family hydrolase [Rhodospirillales bacterium]